jgi:hypothetical protein
MGKLLIGCYAFSSCTNYGTNHTALIGWLEKLSGHSILSA